MIVNKQKKTCQNVDITFPVHNEKLFKKKKIRGHKHVDHKQLFYGTLQNNFCDEYFLRKIHRKVDKLITDNGSQFDILFLLQDFTRMFHSLRSQAEK